MDGNLITICLLTGAINLIGALAYAARIAGVRTRRIAMSFALFNVLILGSRLANGFLGPLLAKRVEKTIAHGGAHDLQLDFHLMLASSSTAVLIGILLVPTGQRIFSVAIATVLFPTLARFANRGEIENLRATMANGMRQILFVLVPAAASILALSDPMIRLVYQRGAFDPAETEIVATALFWFAFSLPTNGLYLLQTRTFFSLQRPWQATALATIDLVVSAVAALALYKPFGVGGIVALHAGEYPDISITELKSAIAAKKVTLIDANGSDSYKSGHIPGAIDFQSQKADLSTKLPTDKGALVVAYCANPSCGAYAAAAKMATKLGYTNVKHLSAGIMGWKDAGAPLEK